MAAAHDFTVGLDLGQSADFTALSVVERVPAATAMAYHVRHLERFPLGTPYPQVVARTTQLLATPPLGPGTPLLIDRTGVGAAIGDMFETGGLAPYGVTITGGDQTSQDGRQFRVPKRDLVGVLVMLFQSERLKIAAGLGEGATLVNELTNFRLKINVATGNDSYEAWRESVHDDLVLSVAMACWHAERIGVQSYESVVGGRPGVRPYAGMPSELREMLANPRRYDRY